MLTCHQGWTDDELPETILALVHVHTLDLEAAEQVAFSNAAGGVSDGSLGESESLGAVQHDAGAGSGSESERDNEDEVSDSELGLGELEIVCAAIIPRAAD